MLSAFPLSLLQSKVEHAFAHSANLSGNSTASNLNITMSTNNPEPTPFPVSSPTVSKSRSQHSFSQPPPTPARPRRTYTCSSATSSSATSSSSYFFARVTTSSLTSATSLPQSFSSFGSAFSSNSFAIPLLPPYAPSPLYPPSADDAKAVLSLDGGGVRGVFAPLFFRELQAHLPPDIDFRTLLDLVGGTSTGGVAALMLARLGLPLDKIMSTYMEMPKKMFGRRRLKSMWWLFTNSQHSTERQRKLYGRVVKEALGVDNAPLKSGEESDGKPQCPVFVVTLDTDDVSKPTVFASYSSFTDDLRADAGSESSHGDADDDRDVSILTAALATSAAPTYFHPTVHNGHTYIDGGVGFNNPSEIALKQVTELYGPAAHVHTFISLGTGRRPTNPYRRSRKRSAGGPGARLGIMGMLDIVRAFAHISTDSQAVHERMSERFAQTGAYFRFNPPGLEDVALDDWTAVDAAIDKCEKYLALPETQCRIAEVAARLLKARGMANN